MQKHKRNLAQENKNIAAERVKILFEQAKLRFKKNPELSNRYMQLARRMAMKFRVRFTSAQKRQFCKKCFSYLVPGVNCRVRVYRGMIRYNCLKCKNVARIKIGKGIK